MSNLSDKAFVIEAFPNIDNNLRYFLAFQYDSEFFQDIIEVISTNDMNKKLSFPVETHHFKFLSFHHKNVRFSLMDIKKKLYAEAPFNFTVKPENKIFNLRLVIVGNLFYFLITSENGIILNTNEYSIDHILSWKENSLYSESI